MLILLDRDGVEVATLPYEATPNVVVINYHERIFEYEDRDGPDSIYREVEP